MVDRDPHDVLGVPRGASAADVQTAYRRLARTLHPDAPGGGDAEAMAAVNRAYAVLRNGSPVPHPPTQSENRAAKRPETPIAWEDASGPPSRAPMRLPSRRTVVGVLAALAVLVTVLVILAVTGDEVVEPRRATVTAAGMRFDVSQLRLAARVPVEVDLVNRDVGQRHNVAIYRGSAVIARGAPVTGPSAVAYDFGPLPAGTYTFRCEIVPDMSGTLRVT
ncbi:MAG TPA: DnaJ domain-containing protein [Acidimicrobiales bacterium]|nr:DnaJ domain-containing protein [Acidimicrobiales bacterium]